MSNPYLTMYGYDNSGNTLEHAWLNKAKEKEYNHKYYLMNRDRLLAQQKKLRNPSSNNSYDNARRRIDESQQRINYNLDNMRRDNARSEGRLITNARNLANNLVDTSVNMMQSPSRMFAKTLDPSKSAADIENLQRKANANIQRRRNNIDINQGQAENAYQAELARNRRAIRANAQAEARAKMAENNSLPNRLKQEARKLSYKVGAPIARATSKLRDKAKDIMDKAKAALEKAKNQFRAWRGAGGVGANVGNAAYEAKQKVVQRAKDLYEKAKNKVKELYDKAKSQITGK